VDATKVELRHLRYFVAVAEELHFGRAAHRVGIAQPPLSQQVQQLERHLGTRLLERTRRRVALTDAGRALLDDARRILLEVDRAVHAAQRAGRGEAGALRVAFAASVMFLALPRMIGLFRSRYPGVALELRELPTAWQLDALAAGDVDIGFLREPKPDPTLHLETVMREPLRVAVNRHHRLATRARIPLRMLADEDFVLFPQDLAPGLHAQVLALCHAAGFTPRVAQESRELYTAVSLVEAGVGVTIVPASLEKIAWSGVFYKAISGPRIETRIAMAWRTGIDAVKPVVGAFADIVRAVHDGRAPATITL
jgi:DNA-binding transcriptional LysR family regulator